MTKVAIIYWSLNGHIAQMAEAVLEGAKKVTGAQVDIYQIDETFSEDVLKKMHAAPKKSYPVFKANQLADYDGFLFGMPTRYGRTAAQVDTLLDRTGGLWAKAALKNKFGGVFFATGTQHGGQETTALTFLPFFVHHGIIFVPIGFNRPELSELQEVVGGSPWGAGTISGGDGSRQPSQKELALAEYQGEHFTTIVSQYLADLYSRELQRDMDLVDLRIGSLSSPNLVKSPTISPVELLNTAFNVQTMRGDLSEEDCEPSECLTFGPTKAKRSSVACLACRNAKLRCDWSARANASDGSNTVTCSRCEKLQKEECIVIHGQKGRKIGSKNRSKEQKEAEQAAKAAKEAAKSANNGLSDLLQPLMRRFSKTPPGVGPQTGHARAEPYPSSSFLPPVPPSQYVEGPSPALSSEDSSQSPSRVFSPHRAPETTSASSTHSVVATGPPDHLEAPFFANPINESWMETSQLPARGSPLARMNFRVPQAQLEAGLNMLMQQPRLADREWEFDRLSSPGRRQKLDVDQGSDPVEIGLLTEDQLTRLFAHFFSPQGAHEAAPVLDPDLHTTHFVRPRSALLLSTVALLAAQSLGGPPFVHRLSQHVRYLRRQVFERGYKSLEICQALYLLSLWPRFNADEPEDYTLTLAQALAIALDLRLDRIAEDRRMSSPDTGLSPRECRNGERMLITFFVWDRTASAAEGRRLSLGLPDDFILPWLDHWASHPLASACDPLLIQHAALRYEASLVRRAIEKVLASPSPPRDPAMLMELIREKLGRWLQHFQSTLRPEAVAQSHMVHLLIIYHTIRASLLSLGLPQTEYLRLSGDTIGDALIAEVRLACLDACETMLLQCNVMLHLPSYIALAVVDCARQALRLQQQHHNASPADLAPLVGLLAQVARFLEICGTVSPHRGGPNSKYGQQLFSALRATADSSLAMNSPVLGSPVHPWCPEGFPEIPSEASPLWHQPHRFVRPGSGHWERAYSI